VQPEHEPAPHIPKSLLFLKLVLLAIRVNTGEGGEQQESNQGSQLVLGEISTHHDVDYFLCW
jgi:hypothetical protein